MKEVKWVDLKSFLHTKKSDGCVNLPHCGNYFTPAVQSLSCVWLSATPWTAANQDSLSFTISLYLCSHISEVGDAIQTSQYWLPSSPPVLNLSQHQGLFQRVGSSHHVTKILISFSISPSNDYLWLISFKTDWFDLLAIQRTLKSLLKYHSLKASIL